MSTSSISSSTTSTQEILGRSLQRLARQAPKLESFDALAVSGKFDAQREQAQTSLIDVQNDVSAAQTTDSTLAQLQSLVSQMSQLASTSTASKADAAQFKALQTQLQSALGALSDGNRSATLSLVSKADNGDYAFSLSSADLTDALDRSSQELTNERSGIADTLESLGQRAATLQVESANLNSPVVSLKNQQDAASATDLAKLLLSQPSSALAQATGNRATSAFKLLQD